jgi:hypothetical protein
MIVEYPDHRIILDFVVPTLDDAREAIADGAVNGLDLLREAGLSEDEAQAELARLIAEGEQDGGAPSR